MSQLLRVDVYGRTRSPGSTQSAKGLLALLGVDVQMRLPDASPRRETAEQTSPHRGLVQ